MYLRCVICLSLFVRPLEMVDPNQLYAKIKYIFSCNDNMHKHKHKQTLKVKKEKN